MLHLGQAGSERSAPYHRVFVAADVQRNNPRLFAELLDLGRVLINRQPNADLDVPPNVRYWG